MNGAVTEKAFEEMPANEKLWLLYNTMCMRDECNKKHFKRIYVALGILVFSFVMSGGDEALSTALKIAGMLF